MLPGVANVAGNPPGARQALAPHERLPEILVVPREKTPIVPSRDSRAEQSPFLPLEMRGWGSISHLRGS